MKRKFKEPPRKMSHATRIVILLCFAVIGYLVYSLYVIHEEIKANEAKSIELEKQYESLGQDYKL